jgi:hypothetical protein
MAVIRDFINGAFKNDPGVEVVGIGGFKTVSRVTEVVTMTREIPTTFLEDGSHVNDHIIRNPLSIRIQGTVSNVFQLPSPDVKRLQGVQAQVGNITQYAPTRTQSQISRITGLIGDASALVDRADAIISSGKQAASFLGFTGAEGKTNIQKFIDFIESTYNSDALIDIDMPHKKYDKMCITSFEWERNNQTDSLEFTIEAQQFRFVVIALSQIAPKPAAATGGQTKGKTNKGAQDGKKVLESLATKLKNRFLPLLVD